MRTEIDDEFTRRRRRQGCLNRLRTLLLRGGRRLVAARVGDVSSGTVESNGFQKTVSDAGVGSDDAF